MVPESHDEKGATTAQLLQELADLESTEAALAKARERNAAARQQLAAELRAGAELQSRLEKVRAGLQTTRQTLESELRRAAAATVQLERAKACQKAVEEEAKEVEAKRQRSQTDLRAPAEADSVERQAPTEPAEALSEQSCEASRAREVEKPERSQSEALFAAPGKAQPLPGMRCSIKTPFRSSTRVAGNSSYNASSPGRLARPSFGQPFRPQVLVTQLPARGM